MEGAGRQGLIRDTRDQDRHLGGGGGEGPRIIDRHLRDRKDRMQFASKVAQDPDRPPPQGGRFRKLKTQLQIAQIKTQQLEQMVELLERAGSLGKG